MADLAVAFRAETELLPPELSSKVAEKLVDVGIATATGDRHGQVIIEATIRPHTDFFIKRIFMRQLVRGITVHVLSATCAERSHSVLI